MIEFLKNFVASLPFLPASLFSYLAKPFLYLSKKNTLLAIYLHEKLNTNLGKAILEQRAIIYKAAVEAQALEIMRNNQNQQTKLEENRLATIVTGNDKPSNVFVLNKKDKNNGNKD